jgi:energy-coupling factor transporter ATP-binding protein EcfA2
MFQRFAKFIPVIAAGVAVALALAVLSRVMVTVDTITHPEYRLAYVLGVAGLLGGLALFAWLKLRPRRTRAEARQLPYHRRLTPEDRLGKLYDKHALDRIEAAAVGAEVSRAAGRARDPARLRVAVAGVRGAGKSALVAALARALAEPTGDEPLDVELVELAGLDTDRGRNLERLAPAAVSDLAVFVVDQDLRDYEQAALEALGRRQRNLLVVLNKADLMRAIDLAETRAAIAGKLASARIEADILTGAAAPKPAVRIGAGADGGGEEEVDRPAEVSAIVAHLEALAARRGRGGVVVTTTAP